MAESRVRRQKRDSLAASSRALTSAQRLKRAAAMTAAGRKLRAAGLASRGKASTSEDIDVLVDLPPSRRRELLAALALRSADRFPVDLLPARGRADRGALDRLALIRR